MTPIPDTIEGVVVALSQSWFDEVVDQLARDGRRVEGGWPGTISDARRRLLLHLQGPVPPLLRDRLDSSLAKVIYQTAKSKWLAVAMSAPG